MSENSNRGSRVGVIVLTLILIITSIAFIKVTRIVGLLSVRGYECGYSQARCDFSNEVDKKINCEAVPDRCYQFIKTKK